jgi:hypothetical protein
MTSKSQNDFEAKMDRKRDRAGRTPAFFCGRVSDFLFQAIPKMMCS